MGLGSAGLPNEKVRGRLLRFVTSSVVRPGAVSAAPCSAGTFFSPSMVRPRPGSSSRRSGCMDTCCEARAERWAKSCPVDERSISFSLTGSPRPQPIARLVMLWWLRISMASGLARAVSQKPAWKRAFQGVALVEEMNWSAGLVPAAGP